MQAQALDTVPATIWQHLQVGNGAWRQPMLASARPEGGADARSVVIRDADAEQRRLVFFTDQRSRKLDQLIADNRVCLALYDDERRLQVRFYGTASRVTDHAQLDTWWEALAEHQKSHYAVDLVADQLVNNEKGRENFAALSVVVDAFHCLWIEDEINTAAYFDWGDDGWHGRPVRP